MELITNYEKYIQISAGDNSPCNYMTHNKVVTMEINIYVNVDLIVPGEHGRAPAKTS